MNPLIIYLVIAIVFLAIAFYFQWKFSFLCSTSIANPKPYSYSKVQLTWWTFIILTSFISITIISGQIPTLNDGCLTLLGLGALTSFGSKAVDISDQKMIKQSAIGVNPVATPSITNTAPVVTPQPSIIPPDTTTPDQNVTPSNPIATTSIPTKTLSVDYPSEGFFTDILSDVDGVSIHRFQAFVFNLVFGVWFIYKSVSNLNSLDKNSTIEQLSNAIPVISSNNLLLLGISAGTYVTLKLTENK